MRRISLHWKLLALVVISIMAFSPPVTATPFAFRNGDVYVNINGGIREFDTSLQPVASLTFPGVTATESLAFTAHGTLVFTALKGSQYNNKTVHLLEIDSSGTVLHDIDFGLGTMYRGSGGGGGIPAVGFMLR